MYSAYPIPVPQSCSVSHRNSGLELSCQLARFFRNQRRRLSAFIQRQKRMTAASRREPSVSTEKDWAFAQPQNERERSFSRGWKIWLEGIWSALKASRFD